jgi:hypothetical protein
MKHMIRDPQYPQWPAHSHMVNQLLGVTRLPVKGMPPQVIQGITVFVQPLPPRQPGQRKRSTHRVMAICPGCSRIMSVGRLHQHLCKEAQ